jgi:hypothetical protein
MACASLEWIGTIPNYLVLGAMCQIQGYTLYLAALELRLLLFCYRRRSTKRLTKLYLGRLIPFCGTPSQQATIARLPEGSSEFKPPKITAG